MATTQHPNRAASLQAAAADAQAFRLYVNAGTPASSRALVNVRSLFDRTLPGRYTLEIVNIADHVDLVRSDQVIASPTLIRLSPMPQQRFIGDMSNTQRLLNGLNLQPSAARAVGDVPP